MTPEELARRDIDRQLAQSGWQVQNRNEMNISAALGVAVREFPTLTGEAGSSVAGLPGSSRTAYVYPQAHAL